MCVLTFRAPCQSLAQNLILNQCRCRSSSFGRALAACDQSTSIRSSTSFLSFAKASMVITALKSTTGGFLSYSDWSRARPCRCLAASGSISWTEALQAYIQSGQPFRRRVNKYDFITVSQSMVSSFFSFLSFFSISCSACLHWP